ncbi:TPR end-of-group domain-containing protein [Pedobacter sp. NJ-S-72]
MRKFLSVLLGLTCATLVVFSQTATVTDEFEQPYQVFNQLQKDALAKKDYKEAERQIIIFGDQFKRMSAGTQEKYSGLIPLNYYNLSCINALSDHKNKAILYLDSAFQNGYRDYKHTLTDTDLDGLRNEEQFKIVLLKIREKDDYNYILQKSGDYNNNDKRTPVVFTYQNADAPELVKFRKQYKLDSISGNGDEISKIKNLLSWVHNVVKHDGTNPDNPNRKNAVDLIEICKKEDRGINCRMMATILKDAYQAMGFKSRAVTCMPKDTADFDCHVINIVWSKTLDKWIWMDPTFNAYVSDKKGNLLNIEEVRSKLILGETLVLNDNANWNNKNKETKEHYLDFYMSKNLYWINCNAKNEWDIETIGAGKAPIDTVLLYPGQFTTFSGDKEAGKNRVSYATNNAAYFWAKPGL